jgi:hypothetical protein
VKIPGDQRNFADTFERYSDPKVPWLDNFSAIASSDSPQEKVIQRYASGSRAEASLRKGAPTVFIAVDTFARDANGVVTLPKKNLVSIQDLHTNATKNLRIFFRIR